MELIRKHLELGTLEYGHMHGLGYVALTGGSQICLPVTVDYASLVIV